MKNTRRLISIICIITILLTLISACGEQNTKSKDTVILFTGNTESAMDYNLGFDGVSAYKKKMQKENENVILADCGGFATGEKIGTITKGQCSVDLMNDVGYDYIVPTRGEFLYGLPNAKNLLESAQAMKLACNIEYTGSGTNYLDSVKPYDIKTVGDKKIGFVGVTEPNTIKMSINSYYQEAGKYVYDFGESSEEDFYNLVQSNIDKCKAEGAEYVFLISHLGTKENTDSGFDINSLISNTTGIKAVMNSSGKVIIRESDVQNKNGEDVKLISTPTKLYYLGEIILKENGEIATQCVSDVDFTEKDSKITEHIENILDDYNKKLDRVVADSNFSLNCNDGSEVTDIDNKKSNLDTTQERDVDTKEVNIGDFCADAFFNAVEDADVAVLNGGAIRGSLPSGQITFGDVVNILPYGDQLARTKATGQQIIDELELGASAVKDTKGTRQSTIMQVSSIKYTIDASIESPLSIGDDGNTKFTNSNRRVKDVLIKNKKTGEYEAIDPDKEYTVISTDYLLKNQKNFFSDTESENLEVADYNVITNYFEKISDNLDKYKNTDGRINIVNE